MEMVRPSLALAVIGLVVLPAAAHHSVAMFDMSKEIVLDGTVVDFRWQNPHVYIRMEIVGPDGTPETRQIEAGPASNLVTVGMASDTIRSGDRIVVRAKPHRSGTERVALGFLLTKADGAAIPLHVLAMRPTTPGATEASSIAGTWVPQGIGFGRLATGSREWPLTQKGRLAIDETREARLAARSECIPFGPPAIMALPSTAIVEVDATEVRFKLDVMDVERVVHVDQIGHPADLEPSLLGHSIGAWEGETLVVDTIGFAAHPEGYAFDLPSSAAKHIVERFTLSADRKHIDYEAIVEDSEYLAEPVSHHSQWDYRPDQKPPGLPCDREVARRFATDESPVGD
jgi:Family of unknown function (DUF6152)